MSSPDLTFLGEIRATFIRGLVVLMPLALTAWFLEGLLTALDGILSPILERWLGTKVPGLGFLSMLVVILFVGALARNLVGRLFFNWFERFLRSIPVVRLVYGAIKDLVGALSIGTKGKTFRQVVLVQYPRTGLYTIGFVTNESTFQSLKNTKQEFVNVYIPNPPNPTSGVLILIPRRDVIALDISIEQGLKFVLSGGIVTPGIMKQQPAVP